MRCANSFLILISFVVSSSAFAESPQLTNILTARWGIETDEITAQIADLAWQPELEWRFEDDSRLTASARLRYQPVDGIRPEDMERDSYASLSTPVLIGDDGELELREFYYQKSVGEWYFTIGKQQVVWGKADGLKVLDVINPQSFREFILEDFDQSRIPLWSVNAEHPLGDWMLQFLWVPDLTYHSLAKPGATYAFSSSRLVPQAPTGIETRLEAAERPTNIIADSDIGLRLSRFINGWDLSLNYLYQYHNQPVLHQQLISGMQPQVIITPRYHRTHVIGTSFSRAFGDWVVRGEVGYFSSRYFITFITREPTDTDGVAESPELIYVLGLDWTGIDDLFISLQLFQSWLPDFNSTFTRPELDTSLTLLLRRMDWNDTLTSELLWITNSNDGDGLVRPKISYMLQDDIELWAGLDIFYGDQNGLFGQFNGNDRLLLGVEVGF